MLGLVFALNIWSVLTINIDAHREAEAKLDRRIVEGPYEDRHAGYPLLKDEYYKKDLNPSTTHKRYKLINIPVLGRILVRFLRYR